MTKRERLEKFARVDIYPVTCARLSRGRTDIDVLRGVIAGGARIIQLREKELTKRAFFELAVRFRELTSEHDVLLVINDHVDIAIAIGADGVHLGQGDLPVQAAAKIARDIIIGVSSHNKEEAQRAQTDGADYVNIGPVFLTKTKEGVTECLGADKISEISKGLKIPFTVMGGIDLDNVGEVVRHGASKVAVVSAITMADDICAATKAFIRKIRDGII